MCERTTEVAERLSLVAGSLFEESPGRLVPEIQQQQLQRWCTPDGLRKCKDCSTWINLDRIPFNRKFVVCMHAYVTGAGTVIGRPPSLNQLLYAH